MLLCRACRKISFPFFLYSIFSFDCVTMAVSHAFFIARSSYMYFLSLALDIYVLGDMDRYRNLFITRSCTPMLRLIFLCCC